MDSTNKIIGIVAAVIILGGGFWYFSSRKNLPVAQAPTNISQSENSTQTPSTQTAPSMQPVVFQLKMQNNSGESGTATLSDENGKTKVVLSIMGMPKDVSQPAHIHTSTCAAIGGVKYPLNFPKNGTSETVIDVSLGSLLAQGPLSLNVHKSAMEISNYVACGNLPSSNSAAAPSSPVQQQPVAPSTPKVPAYTMPSSGGGYSY
jgi:hypothetical protein